VLTILTLVKAPWWSLLAATMFGGGIALVVALEKLLSDSRAKKQAREQKRRDEEAAAAKWVRAVEDCLIWPLPRIDEVDPIKDLSVARSQLAQSYTVDGMSHPPYVERDVDRIARVRLQRLGSVLLIGAPISGVTRSAYELALSTSRRVLVPKTPEGLVTALCDLDVLSAIPSEATLLLWLDRVDKFTEAGLTAAMLARCQAHLPGLRVVSTISSPEYSTWAAENRLVAEAFGEHVRTLKRKLSPTELERAEAAYPGLDFAEGIAGTFTVAATLLRRLHGGNDQCPYEPDGDDCAFSRAIVEAAAEWASTDIGAPLPAHQLTHLARQRLGERQPIEPAHVADALTWATSKIVGGASLLVAATGRGGEQGFDAHAVLVQICRAEWPSPAEEIWTAALNAAVSANDWDGLGRIGYRAHTAGNLGAAARVWAQITTVDNPAAEWLSRAAAVSLRRGEPAGGVPPLTRVLHLTEAAHGPDHPQVAAALVKLAAAWFALGQPAIARDLLERALRIEEREFGPDHPEVAATLVNLGAAWGELGQPAKALDLLERALRFREAEFGPDHPEVARILNNLGAEWLRLGQPAKARDLLERALRIWEAEFDPDHPEVAMTVANLGAAWGSLGQREKARDLLERALHIKEREFGPDHPEVARILNNLGAEWAELGQPAKARDLLERALHTKERVFGPDHPEVARSLTTLGTTWLTLGQSAEACDLFERSLRIWEAEFGRDHSQAAIILLNLGAAWCVLGRPAEARDVLERALQITEQELGPDHPDVAITLTNLANAWGELGQSATARELLQRALRIAQSNYPNGHSLTRRIANDLRRVDPDVIVLNDTEIIGHTKTQKSLDT
jgi:tetratricopeptide (TPR) repeat protein